VRIETKTAALDGQGSLNSADLAQETCIILFHAIRGITTPTSSNIHEHYIDSFSKKSTQAEDPLSVRKGCNSGTQ
jgi:hypothetical protein